MNNGGCDAICRNFPGSYSCECPSGFRLGTNRRECDGWFTSLITKTKMCSATNKCASLIKIKCLAKKSIVLVQYKCKFGCICSKMVPFTFSFAVVNECRENPTLCGAPQQCVNTWGGYSCITGVFRGNISS